MGLFVKLPVETEAVQFTGNNWHEIALFVGFHKDRLGNDVPNFNVIGTYLSSESDEKGFMRGVAELWVEANKRWLPIEASEWIIKDQLGFYPCKDEVFINTYIQADQEPPTFREELSRLINKHSLENSSDTPDFILASFIENVLVDWNHSVRARDTWKGSANKHASE